MIKQTINKNNKLFQDKITYNHSNNHYFKNTKIINLPKKKKIF